MNTKDGLKLTEVRSLILPEAQGNHETASESMITVDATDFFNTSLLKGYLSNNTVLKECSSVSNNTILS